MDARSRQADRQCATVSVVVSVFMWTTWEPKDINELCLKLHMQSDKEFMYRGQSDACWKLKSTLLRDLEFYHKNDSEEFNLMRECCSVELFNQKARLQLDQTEHGMLHRIVTTLILMQHYGGSTRLLDWSYSPWVAAYFAAVDIPDVDGALYCVNGRAFVRVAPNSKLSVPEMRRSRPDGEAKPINLLEVTSAELPLWHKISLGLPCDSISIVISSVDNPRMHAQLSLFTMTGCVSAPHDIIADLPVSEDDKLKIIFPKNLKRNLIERLSKMGITPSNLFPDITGIARRTREAIRHADPGSLLEFQESVESFIDDYRIRRSQSELA